VPVLKIRLSDILIDRVYKASLLLDQILRISLETGESAPADFCFGVFAVVKRKGQRDIDFLIFGLCQGDRVPFV
jgi:hypothetical protein